MASDREARGNGRKRVALICLLTAMYLSLVIARALTNEPYIDESYYAMPAWNLAANGSMGTPVLEPSGSPTPGMSVSLQGIRTHTYWVMPLPTVVQAAWYKVVGFSIVTARSVSTIWSVVLLVAWFFLLRKLGGSSDLALLGIVLIATDYVFLGRAALCRMDMMSAALGFSGIALYLHLRERALTLAILAGETGVCLAGLSHPNGGIVSFCGLTILVIFLDRKRLEWRHAGVAAIPYIAGAAGMAAYIAQDVPSFRAQFFQNSSGRLSGIFEPLTILPREISRYLAVYGLNADTSAVSRVKLVVLLLYAAAVVYVCSHPKIRREFRPLLLTGAAYMAVLALLENYKVQWYVLYVVPFFGALTAVAAHTLLQAGHRRLAQVGVAVLICVQAGGMLRLIVRNTYKTDYLPVIAFLKANSEPNALIMASAQFGFGYGFRENLLDDIRLGYASGRRPDIVVVDARFQEAFAHFQRSEPDIYRYVKNYLEQDCVPITVPSSSSRIYVKRDYARQRKLISGT